MTKPKILIVDDEAAIRDMVAITLGLAGFDSISATFASDDNTTQTELQFPHPNKDISQGRFVRA